MCIRDRAAQQDLSGFDKAEITYLTDLPINELVSKIASLPPDSVIIYAWQQALNDQGKVMESFDVLSRIAAESSAPIYGFNTVALGSGIIGGYLQGPEMNGAKAAQLVDKILSGVQAREIPVEPAQKVPMFDWRQLQRWNVSRNSLPPDSVVRFEEFTFWELYKWHIVGALTLIVLQSAFIVAL